MKIAIAGGGIGGLISALMLRKHGYDVTIFEKRNKLGGRLAFVEEQGYRIDEGPTIVLLPEMLTEILQEAGVSDDQYELININPLYKLQFKDGASYTKYNSAERQLQEISENFPGNEDGFRTFMKDMEIRFQLGKSKFLEKSFHDKRTFWTRHNLQTLMQLKAYKSVNNSLKAYFQDEKIRQAYSLQTLYIGGNPLDSPALYSLISFSEHQHGIYYLKGGYASLVTVLEKELLKQGVEIVKNANVERVLSDGEKAEGLIVNGNVIKADSFVLNGDFPGASKLIAQESMPPRNYTPSSSCVMLYFGLNKVYKDALVHQFFMGSDFNQHMKEIFVTKEVPSDPSFYAFHPSVIDPSLAPEGHGVLYALIPVPSGSSINWKEQKSFIEKMIGQLEERGFPGLRESIQWMKVRTPEDKEMEGLFQGGSFGIAPSLFQSGVFRPQVKPSKLSNVYAAGASIHPGGGVPIVMQGAKLMVSAILSDHENKESEGVSLSG
ncbi:phytoene desaturase family protein [Peribacillus frigoritolerans]|uniref:phytoene desaturase family protein n=1 Tax=Peribacillus frigoritolerans TaxID=450367 RepID=UPI00105AA7FB|nr:phytoene desaturase family protein [Peribacillus frigoritolerans]TDL80706.1 phytoene desaturase [Peribacillus frigoritolerans]